MATATALARASLDARAVTEEHAPCAHMDGFDRLMREVYAYLGFWDVVRGAR